MVNTYSIKRLFKKGQYVFYNALLEKVTFFVLFAFLARNLPKDIYGNVILVFTFSSIIYSFVELGLSSYFQREVSFKDNMTDLKIDQAFYLKIISLIIYLVINLGYLLPNVKISLVAIILIATSIFIINLNSFITSIFYGLSNYRTPSKVLLISRIVFIVIFISFLLFNPVLELLISALFISSICQSYFNINYLNRCGIKFRFNNFNFDLIKIILKSSLPMGIGVVFVWLYNKSDIILIQQFIGSREVAIYAAAYSVYQLSAFFPGIILVPLFTELSYDYNNNNFISFKKVVRAAFILSVVSVLFFVILFMVGDKIITIIYGLEYKSSSKILVYLIIAIPGLYLNNMTRSYFKFN